MMGNWRKEQVWIGGASLGPIPRMVWRPVIIRFVADGSPCHRGESNRPFPGPRSRPPRAQFESNHPYTDGDGRVGRALAQAMMCGGHLTRSVAAPVSTGLLHDRPGHFRALATWRAGDVAPLVRAIATASFASAHNGRILVTDLEGVRHQWVGVITTRRDFAVHRLPVVLVRQPVVDNHCRTVLGSTGANAQ
jgi:hypothetical protein